MTQLTILFDNRVLENNLLSGHGFSCLIEVSNKKMLFDIGSDISKLFYNMGTLGIDPRSIDVIVISHNHWDHVAGLSAFLSLNPDVKIYLPTYVPKPIEIIPRVWSTGSIEAVYKDKKLLEQALLIDSPDGVVIVTGCSHPGLEIFIEISKNIFKNKKVKALIGGWHLIDKKSSEVLEILNKLRMLNADLYIPCHCISDKSMKMAKKVLGNKFVYCGAGLRLNV